MTAVEKIQESAQSLTATEFDQLIESLLAAREGDQVAQMGRRISEIDSGKVEGVSSEKLFAKADSYLNAND